MDNLLEELRTDTRSGASDIARKAALGLVHYGREPFPNAPTFLAELTGFGQEMIATQPSMAPLYNLVNQVLQAADAAGPGAPLETLQQAVVRAAQGFLAKMDKALDTIAEHGQGLLPAGGTVMTHSSSKTVIGIIRRAQTHGKDLRAIVTESRPFCEGRELARHLGQYNIPTRVVLDAAVGRYVREADIIIVGADRVAEHFFVNKMGTLPLAMAAREAEVPFYVACEMNKLLPAQARSLEEALEGSEQRQGEEWMNVELLYSLFEAVPNTWLSGLITEEGILSLSALRKYFLGVHLSPKLSREAPARV